MHETGEWKLSERACMIVMKRVCMPRCDPDPQCVSGTGTLESVHANAVTSSDTCSPPRFYITVPVLRCCCRLFR